MEKKQIISMMAVFIAIVGMLFVSGCTKETKQPSELSDLAKQVTSLNKKIDTMRTRIDVLNKDLDNARKINAEKSTEIDKLKKEIKDLEARLKAYNGITPEQVAEMKKQIEQEQEEEKTNNENIETRQEYIIDDVNLTGNYADVITNDELNKLFDGEIDYNGEDYDVQESVIINEPLKVMINKFDKFGAEPVIGSEEHGAIEYWFVFSDPVEIADDEDLEINFLGSPLEITYFDGDDTIKYLTSAQYEMTLGQEIEVDGHKVKLVGAESTDDNDKVRVSVDGNEKTIKEGRTRSFGSLKIHVKEIFVSNVGDEKVYANLYIGDDITKTVSDGDEYDPDDRFSWMIESDEDGRLSAIGLKLYDRLNDEDEVITKSNKLQFPNKYLTFELAGTKNLDVTDLVLDVGSMDETEISFDGKIYVGNKRIDTDKITIKENGYVTYSGIDDDDKNKYTADDVTFKVGKRQFGLQINGDEIIVGDYEFTRDGTKLETDLPFDDEVDYREPNGDILYHSDINEDDEEVDHVKIGFTNDKEPEVLLGVY